MNKLLTRYSLASGVCTLPFRDYGFKQVNAYSSELAAFRGAWGIRSIPFVAYLSSRLGTFSQHASAGDDDELTDDFEECGPGDDFTDASSTKPTCKLCDQGC